MAKNDLMISGRTRIAEILFGNNGITEKPFFSSQKQLLDVIRRQGGDDGYEVSASFLSQCMVGHRPVSAPLLRRIKRAVLGARFVGSQADDIKSKIERLIDDAVRVPSGAERMLDAATRAIEAFYVVNKPMREGMIPLSEETWQMRTTNIVRADDGQFSVNYYVPRGMEWSVWELWREVAKRAWEVHEEAQDHDWMERHKRFRTPQTLLKKLDETGNLNVYGVNPEACVHPTVLLRFPGDRRPTRGWIWYAQWDDKAILEIPRGAVDLWNDRFTEDEFKDKLAIDRDGEFTHILYEKLLGDAPLREEPRRRRVFGLTPERAREIVVLEAFLTEVLERLRSEPKRWTALAALAKDHKITLEQLLEPLRHWHDHFTLIAEDYNAVDRHEGRALPIADESERHHQSH